MTSWLLVGRVSVSMYTALGFTLFRGRVRMGFYVAVQPFVRRRWPAMLVAWVRVLAGNIRDPLVGRDVLIGCAADVTGACPTALNRLVAWQAGNPDALLVPDWRAFNGTSPSSFPSVPPCALTGWAATVRIVRRGEPHRRPRVMGYRAGAHRRWCVRTFTIVRIGLVAAIVDAFVWTLFVSSPMTLQTSAWYANAGCVSLAIVGAMAAYGFKTALAGRPILEDSALADAGCGPSLFRRASIGARADLDDRE